LFTTATAQDIAERIKRYRATTHLASTIASGDQFTAYAVDDIKASMTERKVQGNKYDDREKDDYIPPNSKMMLLCKQKNKWIAAEEDDLRSFVVKNVMSKNSSIKLSKSRKNTFKNACGLMAENRHTHPRK
jgi:hypothetical protein